MSDWIEMVTGVRRRTLVSGTAMMQMIVEFEAGTRLPEHQHPHEQVTHVLTGALRFTLGGETRDVRAGESIYLASNVPHGAEALERSAVVDTFSPPREDLLAQDRATPDEMKSWSLPALLGGVVLPLYALDQLTKWLVVRHISQDAPVAVIPGWFDLVYWTNTGAAFSMLSHSNGFFLALSSVALVVLAVLVSARGV